MPTRSDCSPAAQTVLDALRARRTYATNGVRSLLRFEVGGQPMGGELPSGCT